MNKLFKSALYFVACAFFFAAVSCNSTSDEFHLQKKYWDAGDYENALRLINYQSTKSEKLPNYADPAKKAVFVKLADANNFKVVLEDQAQGLTHRNDFS